MGSPPDRVLLVYPPGTSGPRRPLDLVLLLREASRHGLRLGLVTGDIDLGYTAMQLGIPVFESHAQAERADPWQRPTLVRKETQARVANQSLNSRPRLSALRHPIRLARRARRLVRNSRLAQWGYNGLALLIALLTISLVATALLLVGPSARLVLRPQVKKISLIVPVTGDPRATKVDLVGGVIPVRVLHQDVSGQHEVEVTEVGKVPDQPAQGRANLSNLDPTGVVTVPVSTTLRTSAGQGFITLDRVVLPPGGQGVTAVQATEPGPAGNVDAGAISRVDGPLALQIRVANAQPTTGGTEKEVQAVTQQTLDRLRTALIQQLTDQATAHMSRELEIGEMLVEHSVRLTGTSYESTDHIVGDQASLVTMELHGTFEGLVVDQNDARGLVNQAVLDHVPAGFRLESDSLTYERAGTVQTDSRTGMIHLPLRAEGTIVAAIDTVAVRQRIRGQDTGIVQAYLEQTLKLAAPPEIAVWPEWLGRLPYLSLSTQIVVEQP